MRQHTDRVERLPGIHHQLRLDGFRHASLERITRQLSRVDQMTMDNIYHVSEYCQGIQQRML
jgi:hypothetical protein